MKQLFKKIVVAIIIFEAKLVLKKYKPRLCVIVGSVGKTTTKDAVYAVLRQKFFVRKSEKSFNSDIGVPLTILGCQNGWSNPLLWMKNIIDGAILLLLNNRYPEWLVLEVGADHPGDISSLASWLQTDIVVLTRLPDVPVHVEFFDSVEDVVKEKASIIKSLIPKGTLIVNGDDERIAEIAREQTDKEIITFGMGKDHTVYSSRYMVSTEQKVPKGIRFELHRHDELSDDVVQVEIPGALGKQHLYPALAAAATGFSRDMQPQTIAQALGNYVTPNGRMKILKGIKETTIIDDSYNSSPVAVEEALSVLEHLHPAGRKIVVLGDMLELGRYSIEEHKKIGHNVADVADILVTVGFRARGIAEGALQKRMHGSNILQYDDVMRGANEIEQLLEKGDLILIKGSQGMRLEKFVAEIMGEPERKAELLVRQDLEWQKR